MKTEQHTLPAGARIAEGSGQCGKCHSPILKGDFFWWHGDAPAYTECPTCRIKRLGAAKLGREAKGAGGK